MDRDRYGDELAVVTATPASDGALERFLDTLETATSRRPRVLIAETAHHDGAPAPARLTRFRPGVQLVSIGEDVGFAAAINRAVAGLGHEFGWLAVAVPDIRWEPGALDVLLATANQWPRAGVVVPRLTHEAGNPSPRGRPRCTARCGGVIRRARHALAVEMLRWMLPGRSRRSGLGQSGALTTVCLLRRLAFDSVDGFDPRYRLHVAGADLGARIVRAGWRCMLAPTAEVTAPAPTVDPAELHRGAVRYVTDRTPGPWRVLPRVVLGR